MISATCINWVVLSSYKCKSSANQRGAFTHRSCPLMANRKSLTFKSRLLIRAQELPHTSGSHKNTRYLKSNLRFVRNFFLPYLLRSKWVGNLCHCQVFNELKYGVCNIYPANETVSHGTKLSYILISH